MISRDIPCSHVFQPQLRLLSAVATKQKRHAIGHFAILHRSSARISHRERCNWPGHWLLAFATPRCSRCAADIASTAAAARRLAVAAHRGPAPARSALQPLASSVHEQASKVTAKQVQSHYLCSDGLGVIGLDLLRLDLCSDQSAAISQQRSVSSDQSAAHASERVRGQACVQRSMSASSMAHMRGVSAPLMEPACSFRSSSSLDSSRLATMACASSCDRKQHS